MYDMMADHCGSIEGQEEVQKNQWLVQNKLLKYGEKLLEIHWEREGFAMYMAAIIALVEQNVLRRWQDVRESMEKENGERMRSMVAKVLHGTVTSRNVDDIMDIYEKVKPILEREDELAKELKGFAEELEWFWARYQHENIEFKR